MSYLFLYLGVTVAGYFVGSKIKKCGKDLSRIGSLQTLVILLLVFLMGSRIGANEQILTSLDTIGLIAFAYTMIIMAFAVAAFFVARKLMGFDRYGRRAVKEDEVISKTSESKSKKGEEEDGEKSRGINRLTILIVIFVVLGIIAGYTMLPASFISYTSVMLTVTLCILLVLIGLDIGIEGSIGQNFRSAGWRVMLFPLVSIISMMIGSMAAAMVLPIGIQDSLCIGSGMGWYSLAPAMLAEYSTRVSAISFMHNVFREVIGILVVPAVARGVGYIECYSIPGSPSMDVCLPVIEKSTSGDIAVYSFINGAILSAAVPILVSIFMNI